MTPRDRYNSAHKHNFQRAYPQAWNDGHYSPPPYPKVKTANGLTKFICNFLMWNEHRATRISSAGRMIDAPERQPSGTVLTVKKYIPGPTRRGSADISATIKGRSVMMEIKIGKDRASQYQLDEQARERKAGGIFEFISTPEEFFALYDKLMSI